MKRIITQWLMAFSLAICGVAFPAAAQVITPAPLAPRAPQPRPAREEMPARLKMNGLDRLESRAKQVVEVSLDHKLIGFLAQLLSDKKPEEAQIKQVILGLKGIYVRSYEFAEVGSYALEDVENVRRQVQTPLWSRIVGVRRAATPDNAKGNNVEVYTSFDDNQQINGLAIIAADTKSLTVVNVVGLIDLQKLRLLEGNFGVPKLQIGSDDKEKEKAAPVPAKP